MKKKDKKRKRLFLKILCVVLTLLLAVAIAFAVLLDRTLGQINRPDLSEPTLSNEEIDAILNEVDELDIIETTTAETLPPQTGEETQTEQTAPSATEVTLPQSNGNLITKTEDVINILLIGQDRRPGQGRQRSDAMILVTVNKREKTLTMTSFMRDLYVNLPEWNGRTYSPNRLNVNYPLGGMEMLDKCLEETFGVVVDHNIEVDFSGFKAVIDAIGGVDIELRADEASYIRYAQSGLCAGVNRLGGEAALAYSRIRELDGDFQRTARQRRVLTAVLEKCRNLDAATLVKLVDTVLPMITTDMTNIDITGYVVELLPLLPELTIQTQTIPANGAYRLDMIRGMSVVVADFEACRELLEETIGG